MTFFSSLVMPRLVVSATDVDAMNQSSQLHQGHGQKTRVMSPIMTLRRTFLPMGAESRASGCSPDFLPQKITHLMHM
ncbi:hypothetical protein Rhsp01_19140 [Rhizobium sp. NBRC 114257]|uniref:Uncharacterized protein n=1 Tax=Rhizobium dioscoreae TaxID=2653122 RepID=A0ABQ0Z1S3_9HYPH|nr:hypothetical protein RsS93_19100 [Rhizobium dioscoreae]GLU80738.1 hypothetical protein Rhsp01_19140 [Rhizobium sp. NBRC 114257]